MTAPGPVPVKPLLQNPPNVTIVNGKRFYSLQNVRRFTGSLNSPRALSVLHHPRPLGPWRRGHTARPCRLPGPPKEWGCPRSQTTPADKDKVLSIFAPDEKNSRLYRRKRSQTLTINAGVFLTASSRMTSPHG